MDVSSRYMEPPLSEDNEEGEMSQWEDVIVYLGPWRVGVCKW